MGEMVMGDCTVGSVLGAMLYQIGSEPEKAAAASLKDEAYAQSQGPAKMALNRKVSSQLLRKQAEAEQ